MVIGFEVLGVRFEMEIRKLRMGVRSSEEVGILSSTGIFTLVSRSFKDLIFTKL